MEIENYSSSHKDWSCRAGLHPPSKADAMCAIPPRAPRLCVHQTGSRGGAEARRARAGLARSVRRGCTRRWKRALHVPPRGGAVGGTACRAPTPVAGSGRLAQRGRPGRGSTYLRTAIIFNLHQPHGKGRIPVYILNFHFSPTARGAYRMYFSISIISVAAWDAGNDRQRRIAADALR